jgi:hypothetical protein
LILHYPMKENKPRLDHPFERNQISMSTDQIIAHNERVLDPEWYDEMYPKIFAKVATLDPQLVRECAEIGRNLKTNVFAVREFTRKYFSQYMANLSLSDDEQVLDLEIRSATEEPIYNGRGMRMNAPFLVDISRIPKTVTVQTDTGHEDFSQREVINMIRTSSPQA